MASRRLEDVVNCGICCDSYNDDHRCPRILSCGHTFCNSCLEKIISLRACCPTCKKRILVKEAILIPINFIVKDMTSIFYYAMESLEKPALVSEPSSNEELEPEAYCSEHSYFKELRCINCESWVCGICATLHHKNCRTLLIKDACLEMKQKFSQKSDGDPKLRNLLADLIETLIEDSADNIEKSKAMKELDYLMERWKKQSFLSSDVRKVSVPASNELEVLINWCKSGPFYVVSGQDQPLYGKVEVNDGQIWISSFEAGVPFAPQISFEQLLAQFGGSLKFPRMAFLKLTSEDGGDDVELVIDTDGESPGARNFLLLCSALNGMKYKGMSLLSYSLGSYYQITPGPALIVKGTRKEDSLISWNEGEVVGYKKLKKGSGFAISLKNLSSKSISKFGVVVSGLQNLKDISSHTLTVKDCGFVI